MNHNYVLDELYNMGSGGCVAQFLAFTEHNSNGTTQFWYQANMLNYTGDNWSHVSNVWLDIYIGSPGSGTSGKTRMVHRCFGNSGLSRDDAIGGNQGGASTYVRPYVGGNVSYSDYLGVGFESTSNYYQYLSFTIPSAYTAKPFEVQISFTDASSTHAWNPVGTTAGLHAYLNSTITAPATVYWNKVNTFTYNIKNQIAVGSTQYAVTSDIRGYYILSVARETANKPVRNQNLPYINSGAETNYIYWMPGENQNYRLDANVSIASSKYSGKTYRIAEVSKSGSVATAGTADTPFTLTVTNSDPSGMYGRFGYLIRNTNSKVVSAVSFVPQYGYYGRIYKVNTDANGNASGTATKLYEGYGTYSSNITTEIPATGSYLRFKIYCDSVGTQYSAGILSYHVPTFVSLAVHRCDSGGIKDDNGDHCLIEWSVQVAQLNGMKEKSLMIRHPGGTTNYNPLTSYSQSGTIIAAASIDSSYEITFALTDSIQSQTRTLLLSTAGVTMDWLYGGTGVSFGKVASAEHALEVGEQWELIAYKMLLGNVDMVSWIKEIQARVEGAEQFMSNIAGSDQFQVTFYNDDDIVSRQWVLSGGDASFPSETPEREATGGYVYTFVGWSANKNAATATANVQKNITTHKDIYAAYSSTIRYYTVFYWNNGTLFNTVEHVNYQQNGIISATAPPTPSGSTFVGWRPSGMYVEENKNAQSLFYYDTEITDSWEDIIRACETGEYVDKYKPGNWKMLDLGSTYGNIKMRISGLNTHYGPGMVKLPISWEADTPLGVTHRMNPDANLVYTPNASPGFTYKSSAGYGSLSNFYEYVYQVSNNADSSSNKATATFSITATKACGVWILVQNYSSSGSETYPSNTVYVEIKRGSTTEYSGYLSNYKQTESYSMSAGSSVTYTVSAYRNQFSGGTYKVSVRARPSTGNVEVVGNPINCTMTTQNVSSASYEVGKGTSGGFARSELRTWLNTTVLNAFPEEVRSGIKTARISQASTGPKTGGGYPYYELVEDYAEADVWIPSSEEKYGSSAYNTKGVDTDVKNTTYLAKQNTTSQYYWMRDAVNYRNFSAQKGTTLQGKSNNLCTNANQVYICFCT